MFYSIFSILCIIFYSLYNLHQILCYTCYASSLTYRHPFARFPNTTSLQYFKTITSTVSGALDPSRNWNISSEAVQASHDQSRRRVTSIIIFDVPERGPSPPAAIPGFTPLGFFFADVPDLVGAMTPCPRKVVFVTKPFLTFHYLETLSPCQVKLDRKIFLIYFNW